MPSPSSPLRLRALASVSGLLALLGACDAGGAADSGEPCAPPFLVATDIDETLTTSDSEWLEQIVDPTHDPQMRPDANTLMNAYADLGYRVLYVTARGEDMTLADGRSSREASWDWLVAHDFPGAEDDLFLAEGIGAAGDAAVAYKSAVLVNLHDQGWTTSWAYGNAESDIEAFLAAGVDADRVFLTGELAGTMGVQPITDDEAYTSHLGSQMPGVDEVACP